MRLSHIITIVLLTSVVSGCANFIESIGADHLLTLWTCKKIATYVSSDSEIFYDDHPSYHRSIGHWALSSSQKAMCVFEPGSPEDVAIALQILGKARTPFAVKGGGHTTNPGFSSTRGVHISMTRFSDVTYNPSVRTATIGAGMTWDDVYATLQSHGVTVVGGRVSGVGVAGFTLGGGYSWLTDQYGLAVDTVEEYELVMSNGTIVTVTESSGPDLFFGLKGGFNNFGIVTKFTLRTFPQSLVWGGTLIMDDTGIDRLVDATQNFIENNHDPKAAIITSYGYLLGSQIAFSLIFYDGPKPPKGLFDDFLKIEAHQDVGTRSYLSLVQSSPVSLSSGRRGTFHTIPVIEYTRAFQVAAIDEIWRCATQSGLNPYIVTITFEPFGFLRELDLNKGSVSHAAVPPRRTRATGAHPLVMYAAWEDPTMDERMHEAIRTVMETLDEKLTTAHVDEANTQDFGEEKNLLATPMIVPIPPLELYGNYAIIGTPVEDIYGDSLPRLRKIKEEVDPGNVMGLAGGWKF
ncbi:FAD-binding domain-containing protein [Gyrodon lividus]|nr:FAD-binding domain-containing protein [Gyrodon lividus]